MKVRFLLCLMFLSLLPLNACDYPKIKETTQHSVNAGEIQSSSANNNEFLEISTDFKEGKVPRDLKETRQEYKQWKSIAITVENNTIIAIERKQIDYGEITVKNGTFIGTDHGEFGGSIKFKPNASAEYDILNENYFGFYTVEDKNYVITGLAHMGIDYGYIYELVFSNNKWQAKKMFDIGGRPEAFLAVDDDLFIVTKDALLVVKNGFESDNLIDNAFWEPYFPFSENGLHYSTSLAPCSMIYGNHSIYIGMYGGMYVYDLRTGIDMWYDFLPENRSTAE